MTDIEGLTTTEEFFGKGIKNLSKEKLYDVVRVYLGGRMENPEHPKFKSGFLYEMFSLCQDEIIRREIYDDNEKGKNGIETQSEYLETFRELLAKAGLEKKHPYEITDVKLLN